jgi:hypothetical protein
MLLSRFIINDNWSPLLNMTVLMLGSINKLLTFIGVCCHLKIVPPLFRAIYSSHYCLRPCVCLPAPISYGQWMGSRSSDGKRMRKKLKCQTLKSGRWFVCLKDVCGRRGRVAICVILSTPQNGKLFCEMQLVMVVYFRNLQYTQE